MAKISRIELSGVLSEDLLTGLDEVDVQHVYFLGLVRAAAELGENSPPEQTTSLVLEIARYAQAHFAFEETMMRVYDYPELERHVAEHGGILKSISQASSSERINLAKLRLHLLNWLLSHISLDDKRMAQFIIASRQLGHTAAV